MQSDSGGRHERLSVQRDGKRLSRTVGGATTRFVMDANGTLSRVLVETNAAGTIGSYYVYGLGLVERVAADGSVRFYHHDSRGSTVALTDGGGTLTDTYAYDPFGKVAECELDRHQIRLGTSGATVCSTKATACSTSAPGTTIRRRDDSCQRIRSQATRPDSQSSHRFMYALNNPIRLVDVSGWSARESSAEVRRLTPEQRKLLTLQLMAGLEESARLEGELAYLDAYITIAEATKDAAFGIVDVLAGDIPGGLSAAASLLTRLLSETEVISSDSAARARAVIDLIGAVKSLYGTVEAARFLGPAFLHTTMDLSYVLHLAGNSPANGSFAALFGGAFKQGVEQVGNGLGNLLLSSAQARQPR